jgi:hypothetical protein
LVCRRCCLSIWSAHRRIAGADTAWLFGGKSRSTCLAHASCWFGSCGNATSVIRRQRNALDRSFQNLLNLSFTRRSFLRVRAFGVEISVTKSPLLAGGKGDRHMSFRIQARTDSYRAVALGRISKRFPRSDMLVDGIQFSRVRR